MDPPSAQNERYVTAEEVFDSAVGWGVALGLIGGGAAGIVAPWVTGAFIWWPTILGAMGVLAGLVVAIMNLAEFMTGSVELAGLVSSKSEVQGRGDDYTRYYVTVSGTEYEIHEKLYNRALEKTAVTLKVSGWDPRQVLAIRRGWILQSPKSAAQNREQLPRSREKELLQATARKQEERRHSESERIAKKTVADKVRVALVELGIDAQLADDEPSGTLVIAAGPIKRVRVETDCDDIGDGYHIICTVPDTRIEQGFRDYEIRSRDARWSVVHGPRSASIVADHLTENETVTKELTESGCDVTVSYERISFGSKHHGWNWTHWTGVSDFKRRWHCYETIAAALLEMPFDTS